MKESFPEITDLSTVMESAVADYLQRNVPDEEVPLSFSLAAERQVPSIPVGINNTPPAAWLG